VTTILPAAGAPTSNSKQDLKSSPRRVGQCSRFATRSKFRWFLPCCGFVLLNFHRKIYVFGLIAAKAADAFAGARLSKELAMPFMKWLKIVLGAGCLLGLAALGSGSGVASAAELYGEPRGPQPARVHLHHRGTPCGWNCRQACPDGYSCAPLYGNFIMPYGSPPYWARYTIGGWGR